MFDSLPSLIDKNGKHNPEAAARAYYEPKSLLKNLVEGESFEGLFKKASGPLELLAVLDGLWNLAKTWTNYDQYTPIKVIEVPIVPLFGCRMERKMQGKFVGLRRDNKV